ncbi:hypothetical protein [uncultured Akkermansia sp.]|uniref:hypothetical protein n=1 Tax=uncultured Akkermansia sp. TaxID=512294 RepID=UPI0026250459|nr:hypothetical protein [uncultured Akkermansia sp.]
MNTIKILFLSLICSLSSFGQAITLKFSDRYILAYPDLNVPQYTVQLSSGANTGKLGFIKITIPPVEKEKELISLQLIKVTDAEQIAEDLNKCIKWHLIARGNNITAKKDINTYSVITEDGKKATTTISFYSENSGQNCYAIITVEKSTSKNPLNLYIPIKEVPELISIIKEIPALEAAAKEEAKKADELLK